MDWLIQNKVVADFVEGKIMYTDDPEKIYTLKRAGNGLLYFPLSRSQIDAFLKVEERDPHSPIFGMMANDSH